MVKSKKATKKFAKTKLADAIKARKVHQEKKVFKERIANKQAKRKREDNAEVEDLDLGQKQPKLGEEEDDMNVDDFLEKGFFDAMDASDDEEGEDDGDSDSDEESDSDENGKAPKKKKQTIEADKQDEEDELVQHKKDLDELKKDKKQAAFLEYLAKEAPGLLDFDAEASSDEEDGEDGEGDEDGDKSQMILTLPILEMWKTSLTKDKSLPALKRLIQAFRVACHMNDNVEETGNPEESALDKRFGYRIVDPEVFNDIVVFVLKNFGRALAVLLGKGNQGTFDEDDSTAPNAADGKEHRAGFIAARFPRWIKLKEVAKSYFSNLYYFINQLSDPKMLNFVLQNTENTVKYLSAFPGMQKKFLKQLLGLWASAAESVRVLAFFNIRKMALELPYPFIDHILKGIYLTYVRNCKFANRTTLPLITFLCNCVVELYGLDFVSSYQHAFVYIRELASHLRNSFTSKKKDTRKNIYNFQYLNSVNAWVRILAAYPGQEQLSLLFYPLVQLIQGTIAYQSTNRYFPLRLTCVKMLNTLAVASNSYINCASYILEILASPDMVKKPRPSMEKNLDIRTSIKVSKAAMGSKIYQDVIFDDAIERLIEYLSIYSRSIAFPELVFPVSTAISKFRKASHNPSQTKRLKVLQDKVLATVKLVQAKRNQISFSPKDIATVSNFLSDEPTPLTRYYDEISAVAKPEVIDDVVEESDAESESDDDNELDSDAGSLLDSDEEVANGTAGSDDDLVQEIDEDLMEED